MSCYGNGTPPPPPAFPPASVVDAAVCCYSLSNTHSTNPNTKQVRGLKSATKSSRTNFLGWEDTKPSCERLSTKPCRACRAIPCVRGNVVRQGAADHFLHLAPRQHLEKQTNKKQTTDIPLIFFVSCVDVRTGTREGIDEKRIKNRSPHFVNLCCFAHGMRDTGTEYAGAGVPVPDAGDQMHRCTLHSPRRRG